MLAFLVQQHVDHRGRGHHAKFLGVELPRLAQDFAQDVVGHRARRAHAPRALALLAGFAQQLRQRFARALARHLHQAQRRKTAHLRLHAVAGQLLAKLAQHRLLVLGLRHVDEIHHHDAAQVAQPQLAGNGLRGFQVGLEHRVVEVARTHVAAGVHVHRGQRFGLVHDQVAARFQIYPSAQRLGDLFVHVVQVEQRAFALVVLQERGGGGHEFAPEFRQCVELL